MDWIQAAVTCGGVMAGYAATHLVNRGRDNKRMEQLEEDRDKHEGRLDKHDNEFAELPTRFVPRQELSETMGSIRESQKRTERWLERLILKRVPPILDNTDD